MKARAFQEKRAAAGGLPAELAAHWRHAANGRVTPQTVRADRLERGEVVVVQGWQLGPFRPSGVPLYDAVRVEADGSLTLVYPLIFVGYHVIGGVKYGERHSVDYEPVGAGGDTTEIRIGLDEVRRRVDDPAAWSELTGPPQGFYDPPYRTRSRRDLAPNPQTKETTSCPTLKTAHWPNSSARAPRPAATRCLPS